MDRGPCRASRPSAAPRTVRARGQEQGRSHRQPARGCPVRPEPLHASPENRSRGKPGRTHSCLVLRNGQSRMDWTLGWAVSGSAVDGLHASRGVALTGGPPGRGDLVDGGEVVCTEVDVHGGDVLLQVGDPPGARDRDYVGALSKDPGKGELAGRDAFAFGDGHHLVQDLEVLVEVLALEAG